MSNSVIKLFKTSVYLRRLFPELYVTADGDDDVYLFIISEFKDFDIDFLNVKCLWLNEMRVITLKLAKFRLKHNVKQNS
jgi:hypothetical protein